MRFEYASYHLCSASITVQASTTLRSATNGSTATRASSFPSREASVTTPPWSGGRTSGRTWMPRPSRSVASASSFRGWSWLPAISDAGDPLGARGGRGSRRRASRPRAAGAGESKTSPAMRTASTLRSFGDPGHLLEGLGVLVHPRAAAQRLADVPVGGVEEAHLTPPGSRRRGRPAAVAATSLLRVAQAGNGKRTRSGVGISGCRTIMVPGLRMPARPRPAAVRKPYSGRSASAASRRPDHPQRGVRHDPALDLGGRLLRADEHDAEAAAALGDVEEHLLDRAAPLARGVLVELVEDDEDEGPRGAERLLLLEHALEDGAHHEALGPVVQGVDVHDAELLPSSSRGRGRRACRRPSRGSGARRASPRRAAAARRRPPSRRRPAAPTARRGSRPRPGGR